MRKLIFAIVLLLIAESAYAAPAQVLTNQTGSTTITTSWTGRSRASVSGTFGNISTGALYILYSTNGGATYTTLQGYSTAKAFNYDVDTTKGAGTNLLLQYTNKSKMMPRAKANAWFNSSSW